MGDKSLLERIEALENLLILEPCTINSSRIGKNADDDEATQLLECELREKNDVQTLEELHIPGMQYNPPVDSRGFFSKCWEELKVLVGVNDRISKVSLNPGELILYSSSGGQIVASIKFQADGKIDAVAPLKFYLDTDFIANNISLVEHWHYDSWGIPTSAPQPLGTTPAAPPATVVLESDIDTATNSKKIDNKQFLAHGHSQSNDSGGDTEVNTGGVV